MLRDNDDLEIFTTPIDDNPYIDEYITFKNTLQGNYFSFYWACWGWQLHMWNCLFIHKIVLVKGNK